MDLESISKEVQNLETDSIPKEKLEETILKPGDDNTFKSQFSYLYKAKCSLSQGQRREELLQSIKERRHEVVDEKRDLTDLLDDLDEIEELNEAEPMDTVVAPQNKYRKRKEQSTVLKNKLMLSEWFTEIPNDLETDWFFKLCPNGTRNLVVAYKQMTRAYNKRGRQNAQFISHLPGGGPRDFHNRFTILDCIYNQELKSYFVLDVLAWNGCLLIDCSTDMRFCWLKSKISETPEIQKRTSLNPFLFFGIDFYPAQLPVLEEKLSQPYDSHNADVYLDGILFYHRDVIYVEGKTPLVGWLEPYMIPEMLSIAVCCTYEKRKPKHYVCLEKYLRKRYSKNITVRPYGKMDC